MSEESSPHDTDEYSSEENVRNVSFGNHAGEDEEGEDLSRTVETDYRPRPDLDRYENEGLDDESDFEPLTPLQIAQANREIMERNQGPFQFWSNDAREAIETNRLLHRANRSGLDFNKLLENDNEDQNVVNLLDNPGPLKPYLERDEVRVQIALKFKSFLRSFKNEFGRYVYMDKIQSSAQNNYESIEVSYRDMSEHIPIISVWIGDAPDVIIPIISEASFILLKQLYPNLQMNKLTVRVTDLPISDELRNLRQLHLNSLVRTRGVVTRCYDILPHLLMVKWKCGKCGHSHGPFEVTGEKVVPPTFCAACSGRGNFRIDDSFSVYGNFQKITIQEPPSSVPPGRLPRTKEVILLDDLAGTCRQGEEIDITGVYKHVMRARQTGFPVFSTVIEANYVKNNRANIGISITEEEKKAILALSEKPDIADRIFEAIAPSIHGHKNIKAAIALSLFGGTRIEKPNGHTVRGDINVLLLGDPGTAKSQFLKYAQNIAPRAIYTTGKGASAVGLTVALHKDHASGEWTIEGGALVLADGGVCLIDEFDKMSEKDRASLHEAMEQQTISISKAGINTTLQARCSVIAACNPVRDRYLPSLSFLENSGLQETILSRFDVICIVRDQVDIVQDEALAKFVIENHQGKVQPSGDISQELLKKYIAYARTYVDSRISSSDDPRYANLYTDLRKLSEEYGGQTITIRNYESMIRLAEAHARLHLRNNVTEDDANFAIRLIVQTFLSTQKYANLKNLEKKFSSYLVLGTDKNDLLLHCLKDIVQNRLAYLRTRRPDEEITHITITKLEFEQAARARNIESVNDFYASSVFKQKFTLEGSNIIYATE